MNMDFKISDNIISLLENNLIKPTSGLENIYKNLITYFKTSQKLKNVPTNDDIEKLQKIISFNNLNTKDLRNEFSYLHFEDIRTIAIDFPFSLQNGIRDTVMICAMDSFPKNNAQNEIEKKTIQSWVPFSLIDNWNFQKGSAKANSTFFKVIFQKYNIYVTDIFKIFFREGPYGTDKRSNQISRYTDDLLHIHKKILMNEINLIKPKAIITLGNRSRDALLKFTNLKAEKWDKDIQTYSWIDKETKILSIPHISGAANGAKSKIISNLRYRKISGSQNEKLAKIIIENL